MGIFSKEQSSVIDQLLQRGMSDFDIAQRICPADEDPELLLEAVSIHRERHDQAATA
ncbi:hypothetical protein [Salipiger sp. CCB-MM3]|uniref:hypothetical protein n=1 Tax=Salipiger sp. CCB-MM3 TaxID=1792508 RepID=UPI00187D92EA|nr:hypothetical protein [Salipiger sp. CCB-MM3]